METRSAGVNLEPETMLPSQFFSRLEVDASLQPEKRLMLAVLEDAVGTFQKLTVVRDRRGQVLFTDTEAWLASDAIEWPFSFVNVCNALSLDVSYMRSGLWRWRDRHRAQVGLGAQVIRFPFRRVNGTRHSVTGRPVGLRRSA